MTPAEREARVENEIDTRRMVAIGVLASAAVWVWAFFFHIVLSVVEF